MIYVRRTSIISEIFTAAQRFSSNHEAMAAVDRHFAALPAVHYRDGEMTLKHLWM